MKKNVTFKNRAINMAGNLYLPNDFSDNKKYAAIVCVHPGSSVKEQTAGIYAGKMAAHGFVTLAFDASYQGESGGEPRYIEEPAAYIKGHIARHLSAIQITLYYQAFVHSLCI